MGSEQVTLQAKTYEEAKARYKPLRRAGLQKRPYEASQGDCASKKATARKSGLSQRPKRARKTKDGDSAKEIKLECDQLVREIVALRDRKCFTCSRRSGLQVGHLIRRGIEAVRWDLQNCNAQCDRCNSRHEEHPEIYEHAFILKFGGEALGKLIIRASRRGKLTYIELSEIRDNLRREKEALSK